MRRLLVLAVLVFALDARADTIDWVPIGNAGNAPDTSTNCFATNCGSVDHAYYISKYEVTNAQYAEFLNAKAASDPLGLYNTSMGSNATVGGITRSGVSGSYTYMAKAGSENKPVNFVSFYDSLRFSNWLNNGQGNGDTETGAYTLLGGTATPSNGTTVARNGSATIFLPSENEWYKAAYYDRVSATYFDYAAGSNTPPVCSVPTAGPNSANCDDAVGALTNVGAYTSSASPYGTFDQGGNVHEWTEQIPYAGSRILRGGGWYYLAENLGASSSAASLPTNEFGYVGFRVAMVPEPACGDRVVQVGEACDDGNLSSGDGCSSSCAIELHAQTFVPLGDLAGGMLSSFASAVSADGSTVVGQSSSTSSYEAFRWTSDGGMVGLGFWDVYLDSFAYAVSADGSVVVGEFSRTSFFGDMYAAFRWTTDGGMGHLGPVEPCWGAGVTDSSASGVSADGSVVVGWVECGQTYNEAFRWTSEGGMVGLGDLPGGSRDSLALGVSADGSVVVGGSRSASGEEAFRWTSDGGMVGLGDLPGGSFDSYASDVSADGSTIVGSSSSNSAPFREAFRWTSDGGMVGLGDLPGGSFESWASATSADGSVVVGRSVVGGDGYSWSDNAAFLWDATNGMRRLDQVLTDLGLDLTGWSLENAGDISPNGRFIVGTGTNPNGQTEAWLAVVPRCGDGVPEAPEACDDGNLMTEACDYGDQSCVVCGGPTTADVTISDAAVPNHRWDLAAVEIQAEPGRTIGVDASVNERDVGTLVAPALTTTTADDLIVAFVSADTSTATQTATVSGGGLTWTLAARSNAQYGSAEIWVAQATGALTNAVITSTPAVGGFNGMLTVVAFANATGIGVTGIASGPAGAPTVTLVGVASRSWVWATGFDWIAPGVARTPAAGQVIQQEWVSFGDHWVQSTAAPLAVSMCQLVAGVTSYCGDHNIDTGNGEECDSTDGCSANCTLERACNDGIDNDGDGFVDVADPGCADAADLDEHSPTLPCDDGADNDGDGLADFPADPGCHFATSDYESPACDDGLDNDGDGKIDWDGGPGMATPDPQCTVAYRNRETANRSGGCGLGAELALVMPLLGLMASRRRRAN